MIVSGNGHRQIGDNYNHSCWRIKQFLIIVPLTNFISELYSSTYASMVKALIQNEGMNQGQMMCTFPVCKGNWLHGKQIVRQIIWFQVITVVNIIDIITVLQSTHELSEFMKKILIFAKK